MIIRRDSLRTLLQRCAFRFSSDPYFILGVDKATPYDEIKKAFYRLANEFHPDKNSSNEAQQKFVVIKQAFESIKMEKGLMKPQNLYSSDDRESIRPNPEKYATDEEENVKNFRDYTVFQEKAARSSEYSQFNTSFQTIDNINRIKIKVEEGEMKDHTDRFNLEQYKAKITSYSENGFKSILVSFVCLAIFTYITNMVFSEKEREAKESALRKLTEVHKRKTLESDQFTTKKAIIKQIQKRGELRGVEKLLLEQEQKEGRFHFRKEKVFSRKEYV